MPRMPDACGLDVSPAVPAVLTELAVVAMQLALVLPQFPPFVAHAAGIAFAPFVAEFAPVLPQLPVVAAELAVIPPDFPPFMPDFVAPARGAGLLGAGRGDGQQPEREKRSEHLAKPHINLESRFAL